MTTARVMKEVNPNAPLTPEGQAAAVDLAARQRRAGGLLMKAINFVGGQVEDTLRLLPKPVREQVDSAARAALRQSYDLAAQSRGGTLGRIAKGDRLHRIMATMSGAIGGAGGLPTALAELPVATTMIFRAVQGVAESHGEDPGSEETRLECLRVFGAGGPGSGDDGVDTAFLGARLSLSGAALNTLISRVAPRFAAVLSQKLAAQSVPILGAAAGAGTNYAFMDYYTEVAHVHFGLRALARTYDGAQVTEAFHKALAQGAVPVNRA
jgi:hypothetical protein